MMEAENENKSAAALEADGEQVTGGQNGSPSPQPNENTGSSASTAKGGEAKPQSETKKEDMTSYNEHPDQVKVGGGESA